MPRILRPIPLVAAGLFAFAAPVLADPPPGHGHGNGEGPPGQEQHGHGHGEDHAGHPGGFNDRDRGAIRAYFSEAAGRGCPPGLAKKGNGCLPPGQAKKWSVGQPLPAGEPAYPLPPELVVQLTPPPAGYNYVRVAGDILMIAAGTSMVVDAIQDLGR